MWNVLSIFSIRNASSIELHTFVTAECSIIILKILYLSDILDLQFLFANKVVQCCILVPKKRKYVVLQFEEPGRGSPSVEGVARPYRIPQLLQVEPHHHHPSHPHNCGQDHHPHPHHGGQDHPHSLDDTDHGGQDPTHDAVVTHDVDTGSVVDGPTTF